MSRLIVLVALSSAMLFVEFSASTALAQEDSSGAARELFVQGTAHYEAGAYQESIDAWTRAYELDPRPLIQLNLAQAYERLSRLDEALIAYQHYLNSNPDDAERRLMAQARSEALRERIASTGVVITGGPDGAKVLIDGEDRGRLPHPEPFPLSAGSHNIEIQADGMESFRSNVTITAGQQSSIEVDMRPASSGGGGGGGSAGAGDEGGGLAINGLTIGLMAGGGALIIGGAITGGLALSAASDAPSSQSDEADGARTLALLTDILIPVGVAAAATGLILMFVLDGDDDDADAAARVSPWVSPELAGILVQGRL